MIYHFQIHVGSLCCGRRRELLAEPSEQKPACCQLIRVRQSMSICILSELVPLHFTDASRRTNVYSATAKKLICVAWLLLKLFIPASLCSLLLFCIHSPQYVSNERPEALDALFFRHSKERKGRAFLRGSTIGLLFHKCRTNPRAVPEIAPPKEKTTTKNERKTEKKGNKYRAGPHPPRNSSEAPRRGKECCEFIIYGVSERIHRKRMKANEAKDEIPIDRLARQWAASIDTRRKVIHGC